MPSTSAVSRARVKPGRTTPKKSTTIDIDAALAEEGEGPKVLADIPTATVTVFGEEFRIIKAINIMNFLGLDSDDPEDTARALDTVKAMVHPDDWKRFRNAYSRQLSLSGKAFAIMIREMIQAATGERPTKPASGSGRTATKATSRQLSAAS